ncbi:MAG: hypothetical protein M0R80_08620 [Proteobacteria bacterium]|jgi:hypothetical protein|nr:hypothetical protein [Pseudomonadota bacterium]
MDNKMKFSQWANLSPHKNLKFHKFCQFKELDEDTLTEMARLRITQGIERPEFRKVPYLLDGFVIFCLSQLPQSLWSEALTYLHDWGIYKVQQEMKNAGIQPLMRGETSYLGITGGTPEEKAKYDEVRTYLLRKKPYDFITLSGHTFLVVSPNNYHPIAYMYMKIDNSANDEVLQHQESLSKTDRMEYEKAGHGLHSGFLNSFDPPENKDGTYIHHVWTGYRGLNQGSASKWLSRYYDNLHWYHMASNQDIDDPNKVQKRRDQYEAIKKDPLLLHPRIKQSGATPRRESALPILSGGMLQKDVGKLNAYRNAVVNNSMSQKMREKWQIVTSPEGRTNIEIGIAAGHNHVFNTFEIPLQKAAQIKQLLQNPELTTLATNAGSYSTSEYIAEKVGIEGKKVGNFTYTPKQIIDAIAADTKKFDACVYPYWDSAGKLHSNSTEGQHPYVQTKIKVAPEKFIPKESYMQQHTHQLLATVAEEMIDSYKKAIDGNENEASETRVNRQKFLMLFRNADIKPEASENGEYSQDFPAAIRNYAQQLRNAEPRIMWPKEYVTQELTNAGYNLYAYKAKNKELKTEAQEEPQEQEPQDIQQPKRIQNKLKKDPSEKRKNKDWTPLIDGMETALLAKSFKYWLQYLRGRKQGEFNMSVPAPMAELPNSLSQVTELLQEFIDFNNKKSNHIIQNTKTANEFDYSLNFIHDKGEEYVSSGWDTQRGDPLTIYGDDEDYADLLKVCDETWVILKAMAAVKGFLIGSLRDQKLQEEGQNSQSKLTSMLHPDNRNILIALDDEVASEALSEFKHTKIGIKPVFNYLRLRRKLIKEGGKIDQATGDLENVRRKNPLVQHFEKAQTEFLTVLHDNVQNYVKRLWQLDLGYGSRRTVGRGPKTQQGGEMFDIGGGKKVSGKSSEQEQLESRYGAAVAFLMEPKKDRSLPERGKEIEGQIFSTSLRRQKAESDEHIRKVQNGLLQIEKATGVRVDRKTPGFIDEVMRLVQAMHTSRQKSLSYVVEVAEREKYHALQNSPKFKSMSPDQVEEEVKAYGRLKAKMFMDQLDQIHTLCPTIDIVAQKMGDRWRVLNRASRQILANMQYTIEKNFFDGQGNLKPMAEKGFKAYLKTLSEVSNYALTGNTPSYNPKYTEITDAIDEITEEIEKAQKAKNVSEDQKVPFRLGLRRFTALFYSVLRQHTTTIADSRKDTIETDLKSLADDRVLSVDKGWLGTAEKVLETKNHYDQPIPADLFAKYAANIQRAVSIAKQRVA